MNKLYKKVMAEWSKPEWEEGVLGMIGLALITIILMIVTLVAFIFEILERYSTTLLAATLVFGLITTLIIIFNVVQAGKITK